jgi:hypothetical protein
MRVSCVSLIVLLASFAATASAEVVDLSEQGFTIRNVAQIAAHRSRVYSSAVDSVGRWWDPAHTFSGLAATLTLDARPGGCFCERLANGGATHLTVVYVARRPPMPFSRGSAREPRSGAAERVLGPRDKT